MAWLPYLPSLGLTLAIVEFAVRIALAIRVVMRRSDVEGTLLWVVVLLLLPGLGILLYVLVGGRGIGAHRASRYERLTVQTEQRALELWRHRQQEWDPRDNDYRKLSNLVTALGGVPPLRGNSLELMDDAKVVLDRLVQDIHNARRHCHLLYYIWRPAGKGVDVGEALIRAAKRGVECRVLVDAAGSREFLNSPLCDRMRAGGVQVAAALPVNAIRTLLARVDLRNHRKIAVIDGNVAYSGSQNLSDEMFTSKLRRKVGPWIDTTIRIRGPAVQALQTVFLQDWLVDSEEPLTDFNPYFPNIEPSGSSIVHVISSGPGPRPEAIHQAILGLIFAAQEEIIMTTPYFIPDPATHAALVNAALRGVEVTLVLPDALDARVVAAAGRAYYEELLVAGVRILHHEGGLLHAKNFAIDRRIAVITSANLDQRSFWLNFETTVIVYDDDFASVLRFLQTKYVSESVPIRLAEWRSRPWLRQLADNGARLLSPLL